MFITTTLTAVPTASAECWTFAFTCGGTITVCADTLNDALDGHQIVDDLLCGETAAIRP